MVESEQYLSVCFHTSLNVRVDVHNKLEAGNRLAEDIQNEITDTVILYKLSFCKEQLNLALKKESFILCLF